MAELSRLAGVSVSTVSRALAGNPLIARETREEIVRLAREIGYVVNQQAQGLRLKRTQTVSVVIPLGHESGQPLTDPFFIEIVGHLADQITLRGYGMFLQKVPVAGSDWLAQLVGSHRSDGILVIGQSTEHPVLQAVAADYRPLVVWGGQLKGQAYCTVGTDNVAGARAAVEHLVAAGRRDVLFVGDPDVPEIGLRYEGYRSALKATGAGPARLLRAHLTADAAYEAIREHIRSGPPFDAVVGASDVIAISAIRALAASGRRVPDDVAVVGYDDIALAAHANPPLTTVRQDLARGARLMVDLLFRRIGGEDAPSVTMPVELVVRESCGAANFKRLHSGNSRR
jgi:DNA-binding LacI/PurR family transcriptional regulator